MPQPNFQYLAHLNAQQMLAELRRINQQMEDMQNRGNRAFGNLTNQSGVAGAKLLIVADIIKSIASGLLELGAIGAKAIGSLVKDSTQLATVFDAAKASFVGIFKGNEKAAVASMKRIQATSREVGVDLTELAGAFLPKVESLKQFEEVAKVASALALAQPEQGAVGARIALQEALSGSLLSLQKRFEIAPEDIKSIKQVQEELGNVEGLVVGLGDVLQAMGRDLNTLGDTAQAGFNRAGESANQLKIALGEPIVEELAEQFGTLNEFLDENFDELQLVAAAFGDVVANVVEFLGTGINDFLEDLDTDQVIDIANGLFEMVEQAKVLTDVLGLMEFPQTFLDGLETAIESTNKVLITITQITAIAKAELARAEVQAEAGGGFFLAQGRALAAAAGVGSAREQQAEIDTAGEEAYKKVIEETALALRSATENIDENIEKQAARREEIEKSTQAGEDEADTFLALQAAEKAAAEAAEQLANAQEKVDEAFDKLDTSKARKELDLAIKAEQAALDAALAHARKREDIAKSNARKLEDIHQKHTQAVTDATEDMEDDDRDLARAQANERARLEVDLANKRVDIATDFSRRIEDINRQFARSAREAARTRDATAFLAAQETAQFEVGGAGIERERSLQDLQTEGERKREALHVEQELEREEQEIANEQKLEDLQEQLDRELEKQAEANERALEDQRISEDRKKQDLDQARIEDEEKLRLSLARKLEDLNKSLADELAILSDTELRKRAEYDATADVAVAAAERITAAQQQAAASASRIGAGRAAGFGGRSNPGGLTGLAEGGEVAAGQAYIVGDAGQPEVFVPGARGYVYPSVVSALPQLMQRGTTNNDNRTNINVDQSLLDPAAQSAEARAIARNEIIKVFEELV